MVELFAGGVSRALGLALVQFVWQGAAISLAIAAVFALMRQASSEARYVTGCVALVAMMIAPVVTFSLSLSPVMPLTSPDIGEATLALAPLSTAGGVHEVVDRSQTAFGLSWLPAVTTLWSIGVLVLTFRLLGGWLTVRRFRTTASLAVPEVWMTKTAAVAKSLGITRHVTIGASPAVDVPTVVGWIRPAILVPASAFAGLSPFQFEAILAHELAHIRRQDYLVNVMQSVVETLLFYHPGVWWLSSRLRAEREQCCDDMAVAYCGDSVAYAGALASLEHLRLRAPIMGVAANSGDLLTRIQRVLGVQVNEERSPAVAVAIITLALLLGPLVGIATQGTFAAASPAELTTQSSSVIQQSIRALPEVRPSAEPTISSAPAPAPAAPTKQVQTQGTLSPERPATPGANQDLRDVERRLMNATLDSRGLDSTVKALVALRDRLSARVFAPAEQTYWTAQIADLSRQLEETTLRLRERNREVDTLVALRDQLGAPAKLTVAALEERLRVARVNKDAAALSDLLDVEFMSTDPTGATLNRTQAIEAFRNWIVRSITIELLSGSMLEKTAFSSGSETIIPGVGASRVQFTRVWTNTSSGWKLLRSVEFFATPPLPVTIPAAGIVTGSTIQAGTAFRVGGDIKEPRLLTPNARPVYPETAKAAGLQGLVIIEAIIDPDGSVSTVRVIKSVAPELDQAAVDAVSQWKYSPTLLNGVPVSVLLNATVNFALAPR